MRFENCPFSCPTFYIIIIVGNNFYLSMFDIICLSQKIMVEWLITTAIGSYITYYNTYTTLLFFFIAQFTNLRLGHTIASRTRHWCYEIDIETLVTVFLYSYPGS